MMRGFCGCVLVLSLLSVFSWHVQAQGTSAEVSPLFSFGIVDQQRVMATSQAARMVLEQKNAYLDRYQSQAAQQEKALREEEQKLLNAQSALSAEEYAHLQKTFHAKVSGFQKDVQIQRRQLEQSFSDAMAEVRTVLIRVAYEVARERGMRALFYRSQVFLFDPELDITEDLLTRLDQRLPQLSMADPSSLEVSLLESEQPRKEK